MSDNLKGNLLLLLAAVIWGFAFVAQDTAALFVGAFTINGIRSLIGAAVLLPLIFVRDRKNKSFKGDRRTLLIAGVACGVLLCIASNIQQFGIALYPESAASSGRSGFITALYVVIVPALGVVMHKKVGLNVWLSVILATFGMYLLCFAGGVTGLYTGDIVVFACAAAFSLQILCIDRFADRVDGVKLSAIEFLVCGLLSCVLTVIFEKPSVSDIMSAAWQILYLGVMSSGVAYTLQTVGQQMSKNPTVSSLIMSLESVFAAIGGALFASERLSVRELAGCLIMFSAIILSQVNVFGRKKEKAE